MKMIIGKSDKRLQKIKYNF